MNRKGWVWLGQAILVLVLVYFIWRRVSADWREFSSLDFAVQARPTWIVASGLLVWASYALLIEAWRGVLRGWQAQISYASASAIWCVSNLGRYLPGKIWSIAGLAVLAQRAGVNPMTATASAIVMQALAIATGTIIVVLAAPASVTSLGLIAALTVAAGTVALLTVPAASKQISRLLGRNFESLPPGTVLIGVAATTLSWLIYGTSFWLLGKGLIPDAELSIQRAVGVFASGYILGLIALFAPGGIGVREGVFVALLSSSLGLAGAITLSVASRILMTLTELGAVLVVLPLKSRLGEP